MCNRTPAKAEFITKVGSREFSRRSIEPRAGPLIEICFAHEGEGLMPLYCSTFRSKLAEGAVLALLLTAAAGLLSSAQAQGMNMPGMEKKEAPKGAAAKTASGTGTVTALNAGGRKVTLDHGPMPEINWPPMKMEFAVAGGVDLSKVKAGDKVRFTITGSGSAYTIQSLSPSP
jgi:Cu(I)/Ag(I) efflux system periplasmic protein CusF